MDIASEGAANGAARQPVPAMTEPPARKRIGEILIERGKLRFQNACCLIAFTEIVFADGM